VELSADNQTQLFLPKGFAHGYSVLSERAIVQYKVDAPYNPQAESGIRFDDPDLGINWQVDNPKLSRKDQKLPFLKQLNP
jgi:dTDP-4-dehydrorhamnose 3,5-epimerase